MCSSDLGRQLAAARRELEEARAVLEAIRAGEADALVVDTENGPAVYTLKSADEPYRALVETLNEGALTATKSGLILYCNEAFARIVGSECDVITGTSLVEFFGDRIASALTADETRKGLECSLMRRDGARRECLVSSARHEAEGETVFCLLVTDVTGQTLRLLHAAIVESTDDAVISFDQNGRISTWNRGAEALFKYTAGEAIGADASLLVAPLGRVIEGESPRGAFDAALSGRVFRADTQRVARDGSVIDVSVTASPVRAQDGAIIGAVGISGATGDEDEAFGAFGVEQAGLKPDASA